MKTGIIIPARLGSTRLPNKPLLDICGKPMIQRVYERACESGLDVYIAVCDELLAEEIAKFGGRYIMTSKEHKSGTDRIAEAAKHLDYDFIINLQGDEPLINPRYISLLIHALEDADMATLMVAVTSDDAKDPNLVKVICDLQGYAIYFSRSPIPYVRDINNLCNNTYNGHIGIYGYRKDFLMKYPLMNRTPLEICESLEQLRAIENGYRIKVVAVEEKPIGVDTIEDYNRVCSLFADSCQ